MAVLAGCQALAGHDGGLQLGDVRDGGEERALRRAHRHQQRVRGVVILVGLDQALDFVAILVELRACRDHRIDQLAALGQVHVLVELGDAVVGGLGVELEVLERVRGLLGILGGEHRVANEAGLRVGVFGDRGDLRHAVVAFVDDVADARIDRLEAQGADGGDDGDEGDEQAVAERELGGDLHFSGIGHVRDPSWATGREVGSRDFRLPAYRRSARPT